jgi:hypothetical protein
MNIQIFLRKRGRLPSMDQHQVLIRTAKGQEELRTKASGLSPALRHLLILLDGHHTMDEILAQHPELRDEAAAHLDALLADGFLVPHESAFETGAYSMDDWDLLDYEHSGPLDAAPAGVPIPAEPAYNLEKAKGFARFVVLGALGPVGATRIERIDAATSAGELRAELDDLRDVLPQLLSKRQAKQVWEQLEPLMTPMH